jgi:RNA polymerase sigma-70 factor (ECF subfamily)
MLEALLHGRSERLFERYRRRGDSAALAEVFDRTAPELFGLAARLAPAPGLAQDLLQQTFLSAIEAAESWDARRRLEPWLVGILVREARLMRRRERRVLDPDRLATPAGADPAQAAEERDFAHALRRTLEALPARYRSVLELYLWKEMGASEIARELGRTNGAVRVQIHRGLELLRKALPAGFALAGAHDVVSAYGLAEVRAAVLAGAGRATATTGPALAGGSGEVAGAILGGVVMKAWTAVVLVLVAGGALWWLRGREGSRDEATARGNEEGARVPGATPSPEPPVASPPRIEPELAATSRVALDVLETGATREGAGLHGRVLESTGKPVPGFPVALVEFPDEIFDLDAAAVLAGEHVEPELVLASTRTDEEGRFRFEGARPHDLHALALDLAGRRASLRLLEEALHASESADLGDIVLAASVAVSARVVDARGEPLEGVRVRALDALLERFLAHDLQTLRSSSLVARIGRENRVEVFSLPAWVLRSTDRLPVPTARTGTDGRFTLDAPREREFLLCVDDPTFTPLARPLRISGASDLGDLVLEDGRALACTLVDSVGAPVEGAEVFAGTLSAGGTVAVCEPARQVGAGRYERRGSAGRVELYLARRRAGDAWTTCVREPGAPDATLTLPAERTLTLEIIGAEGQSVEALELALQAEGLRKDGKDEDELAFLGSWVNVTERLQRLGPTTYALAGCTEGGFRCLATAQHCAPTRARIHVAGENPLASLRLEPERLLRVRVRDEETGAPLSAARVTLRAPKQGRHVILARATTDANGRAMLPRGKPRGDEDEPQHVRAELHGYAVGGLALGEDSTEECELHLARPASVEGRVHADGEAPRGRYLVILQPLEAALRSSGNVPWHALTDAEGRFRLSGLPGGAYFYNVGERFLTEDPLTGLFLGDLFEAFDADKGILERRVARGALELSAGGTAQLEVDLAGTGAAPPARVAGRLVQDGRGLEGIVLELDGEDSRQTNLQKTAPDGTFDFGLVPAGRVELKAEDRRRDMTILSLELELVPGEERALDLYLDPFSVDLAVVSAESGRPLDEVELSLQPHSRLYARDSIRTRTDAAGRCRVTLPGCGSYGWSAQRGEEHCVGRLDVASSSDYTLRFRLTTGLDGEIELEPELRGLSSRWTLQLTPVREEGGGRPEFVSVRQERPIFEVLNLAPGRYELVLLVGAKRSRPLQLVVPKAGLTDQRLVFAAE